MVTIKDIADLAGVAKSTVSRYLNDGQVSPATREKIKKVIEETGYKPNTFARSLKAQHTNILGVIIPRLNSPSTNDVLTGIDEACRKSGYQLLITNSNQSEAGELANIEMLIKQKAAGIILLAQQMTEPLLAKIHESPVPVLILGQEATGVHSIVHDDYDAGCKIAQHALSLGHETFLFVGVSPTDRAVGVLRKQGFVDEVSRVGKQVQTWETSFSRREAYQTALKRLPDVEATYIACATDNIAMAVLKAAYELGYAVPQRFSLSGFGGYAATDYVHPAITTVSYPYQELGIRAVHVLEQLMRQEDVPVQIMMENQLTVKKSTMPYKA